MHFDHVDLLAGVGDAGFPRGRFGTAVGGTGLRSSVLSDDEGEQGPANNTLTYPRQIPGGRTLDNSINEPALKPRARRTAARLDRQVLRQRGGRAHR